MQTKDYREQASARNSGFPEKDIENQSYKYQNFRLSLTHFLHSWLTGIGQSKSDEIAGSNLVQYVLLSQNAFMGRS